MSKKSLCIKKNFGHKKLSYLTWGKYVSLIRTWCGFWKFMKLYVTWNTQGELKNNVGVHKNPCFVLYSKLSLNVQRIPLNIKALEECNQICWTIERVQIRRPDIFYNFMQVPYYFWTDRKVMEAPYRNLNWILFYAKTSIRMLV